MTERRSGCRTHYNLSLGIASQTRPPEDGDHYRHTNVDVSKFDGTLELHVQEYTEFESIGQGIGHTEPADAGDNATHERTANEEAATDGGEPSVGGGRAQRTPRHARRHSPPGRTP